MRFAKIMVTTAILSSCTNSLQMDAEYDDTCEVVLSFQTEAVTRASAKPEDYFSKINLQLFNEAGEKVFTTVKTQTKDEQSFGSFTLNIAPGKYTVVCVGHSSVKSATIKSNTMVQFTASDGEKLTDTFSHCSEIEVDADSDHELRMNRVAAMFVIKPTDIEVPETFAKLRIDYTGGSTNFNPTTSQGTTKSSQSELRNPANEYQCYTFPYMSNEGKLQVTLTALNADGAIIRSRSIADVPVTRNKITTYEGPIFEAGDGEIYQTNFGLTVNGEWEGEDYFTF